ncbi:MAG: hypothetical protein L0221_17175, partial [Chloroflexi bacterium]|nr:hypothetical protein [Chloroflexota bacterium]
MRVLAVTSNASLVVALGSMMREWEVVTVRDIEHATTEGPGSAVALIDLGQTDPGVQMADQLYQHGVTIPCVVVGDVPLDDGRAFVLVRPFSLEDLGTAVRDAASRPARASVAAPVATPPAVTEGNGSAVAPPVPATEPVRAPEPEPVRAPEPVREPEPAPIQAAGPAVEITQPEVEEVTVDSEPEPVVQ